MLTVIDEFTWECFAISVDRHIRSELAASPPQFNFNQQARCRWGSRDPWPKRVWIDDEASYSCHAVDHEGEVLETVASKSEDCSLALAFLKCAMNETPWFSSIAAPSRLYVRMPSS